MNNLVLNQDIIRKGDTVFVYSRLFAHSYLNGNEYPVTGTVGDTVLIIDQNGETVSLSDEFVCKVL